MGSPSFIKKIKTLSVLSAFRTPRARLRLRGTTKNKFAKVHTGLSHSSIGWPTCLACGLPRPQLDHNGRRRTPPVRAHAIARSPRSPCRPFSLPHIHSQHAAAPIITGAAAIIDASWATRCLTSGCSAPPPQSTTGCRTPASNLRSVRLASAASSSQLHLLAQALGHVAFHAVGPIDAITAAET